MISRPRRRRPRLQSRDRGPSSGPRGARSASPSANEGQSRAVHSNVHSGVGLLLLGRAVRTRARGAERRRFVLGFGTTTPRAHTPRSATNHRASAFRGLRSE